jgi:DNA-binding CsgD family transcriptional regulator
VSVRGATKLGLLEREQELAAIEDGLDAAADGRGAVIACAGPAGIGKSRLLAVARERAQTRGVAFMRARASELERDLAFGVVRQLLDPLVERSDPAARPSLFAGPAALAASLFNRRASVRAASDEAAFAMLHGLFWVVLNATEQRPLVLAADDLQWCDRPSLDWLGYLARRIEGVPLLLLVALREPGGGDERRLAELLAVTSARLRPAPLSVAATTQLLAASLGAAVDPAFSKACRRLSGGNPLLLSEIAMALAGAAIEPRASEIERLHGLAPGAVAHAVQVRVSRLTPPAAALARALAILGEGAELHQAAMLSSVESSTALHAADELVRASILLSADPPGFVHPLIQEAIYQAAGAAERDALHRSAASLLADAGGDVERVGAHLLRTSPAARSDAARRLREAASRALARGAPQSAITYLSRALKELPPGEGRAEFHAELGTAYALGGDPASAANHLRQAVLEQREPQRRAALTLQLARSLFIAGEVPQALAVLERAVEHPGDASRDLCRRLEAELIGISLREPVFHEQARQRLAASDAKDSVDTVGDRSMLCLRAAYDSHLGRAKAACVERIRGALADGALIEEAGAWVCWVAADVLYLADELTPALEITDRVREHARDRGSVSVYAAASAFRSRLSLASGQLADADADARGALEAFPQRDVVFLPYLAGWLAQTLLERGDLDGAAKALDLVPDPGERDQTAAAVRRYASGCLHLARGEPRAALSELVACGDALQQVGWENPAISHWRSQAAVALARLEDNREAERLADEAVALARAWGAPGPLGATLRAQALVHRADQIDLLHESVAVLADSPRRLELAHALADLGAALRRAGCRTEAREPLRHAVELAQASGATPLAERVREELLATGARPRRLATTGIDALTPRERRVASLAARGMSNREIAQELFVVPRTVEMHLSNAFTKLGLSSRTQLADAFSRHR